jgi:hypothetical protein
VQKSTPRRTSTTSKANPENVYIKMYQTRAITSYIHIMWENYENSQQGSKKLNDATTKQYFYQNEKSLLQLMQKQNRLEGLRALTHCMYTP